MNTEAELRMAWAQYWQARGQQAAASGEPVSAHATKLLADAVDEAVRYGKFAKALPPALFKVPAAGN